MGIKNTKPYLTSELSVEIQTIINQVKSVKKSLNNAVIKVLVEKFDEPFE